MKEIVKQLGDFFGVLVGGSYVLVQEGILTEADIADVDVLIRCDKERYKGAVNFVRSLGYQCRTPVDEYGNTNKETVATKEGSLPIHFCWQEKKEPWWSDPIDVLCYKMRRGTRRDWKHIELAASSEMLVRKEPTK